MSDNRHAEDDYVNFREIRRLRNELHRLNAELYAERHADAHFHAYGDGSWRLVEDSGFLLAYGEAEE